MLVTGVIRRQVAESTRMPRACAARDERLERLVTAQQRVDPLERRRVVAVRAPGGKDRRQVDDVRAERLDVVEVRLDARGGRRRTIRTASPARGPSAARPRRRGMAQSGGSTVEPARGETVREDLVDDRLSVPVRARRDRRSITKSSASGMS